MLAGKAGGSLLQRHDCVTICCSGRFYLLAGVVQINACSLVTFNALQRKMHLDLFTTKINNPPIHWHLVFLCVQGGDTEDSSRRAAHFQSHKKCVGPSVHSI